MKMKQNPFLVFILSLICNHVSAACTNINDLRAKPFERQRHVHIHCHNESFRIKNNIQRHLFTWRHLEVGQYVAQSGLYLHRSEPQSSEENQRRRRRKKISGICE